MGFPASHLTPATSPQTLPAKTPAGRSSCSPTPTKRTGRLSSRAMATAMPPLAVPSSLVSTMPVTPADLRELAGLLQAVLAGRCVHHQQHFVRRAGNESRGGSAHLVELVHQSGFGVQAAGGVDVEIVDAARLGGGDGVVEHGRRVAALTRLDHLHARARGPDFELLDRRGAKSIGGAEEHGVPLCAGPRGELAAGGRFAGAVNADEEGDLRRQPAVSRCRTLRAHGEWRSFAP